MLRKIATLNRLVLGAATLAFSALASPGSAERGPTTEWSQLETGEEVYLKACATCHGARGSGVDRTQRGFEVPPPDFTDCKFNTREPRNDWVGIATKGGPLKGFSPLMPAFGKALSRRQLEAAVAYAKGFCPESGWPEGELNLPRALNTGKAFPEDEVTFSIDASPREPGAYAGKLVVARRLGARHQLEAVLPMSVHQIQVENPDGSRASRWGEGVGDIGIAWKSVLWSHREAGSIGGFSVDVFLPTGDEQDGLSDGLFAFEPALRIGQIIPYVGYVQLQSGVELTTNAAVAPPVVFWRGTLGHTFRREGFGRAWSPMIEVLGSRELTGGAAIEWAAVPQLQVALSKRQHIRLGIGVLVPLTDFEARPIRLQSYVMWDWYDGGLGEGW